MALHDLDGFQFRPVTFDTLKVEPLYTAPAPLYTAPAPLYPPKAPEPLYPKPERVSNPHMYTPGPSFPAPHPHMYTPGPVIG